MIKIRKFKLSDLPEVMDIEKNSFPESLTYPKSYFQRYYLKYLEGFIVVENKRNVIGYTIGQVRNQASPTKNWWGMAEIISLAVLPEFRQKGIGKKLTKFLIEHFQKKNIKEVLLHVRVRNKAAVSFYQNFRFKILKKIKNYYRNGDDAYLMKMEI